MVGENALDSAEANLLIDAKFTANSTDVLSEGSTNLYFTNERVDDRVSALVVGGNNITATYNDTAGTLTLDGQPGYTDGDVGTYLSTNGYATSSSIIGTITDNAPGTLDTLNELAAALGDDANFSTTVTNNIATKLPLAGGTMTGTLNVTQASTADTIKLTRGTTAHNNMIKFVTGSTDKWIVGQRNDSTDHFRFYSYGTSSDVLSIQTDGKVGIGTVSPAHKLDVAGTSRFTNTLNVERSDGTFLQLKGNSNNTGYINWESNGFTFYTNGPVEALRIGSSGIVVNEDSRDYDFRVESNSNTHMLFVNGGSNAIGINNSAPAAPLHLKTAEHNSAIFESNHSTGTQFFIRNSNATTGTSILLGFAPANNISGSYIESVANEDFSTNANRTANMMFYTRKDGNYYQRLYMDDADIVFNNQGRDTDFRVESNNNTHMLFIDGGNDRVCIGHSSTGLFTTSARFEVDATSNSRTAGITTKSSALCLGLWNTNNSSGDMIQFSYGTNGTDVGSITHNGSGVTYNTTSDRRLKDNIEPISDATNKLMDMKPVTHTWIDKPDEPQVHGFIAQEMQEVVPEAVSGDAESDEMMSMDYGRITPVIVAALQDALKEIKELKTRIDELENK